MTRTLFLVLTVAVLLGLPGARVDAASPRAVAAETGGEVVRGLVLDLRDDAPLVGAEVILVRRPARGVSGIEVARARTDAAGRFELHGLDDAVEDWSVIVRERGFVAGGFWSSSARPGAREQVVRLAPGMIVTGEVRFADGRPVRQGQGRVIEGLRFDARAFPGQGYAEARYAGSIDLDPTPFALDDHGRFEVAVASGPVAIEISGRDVAPALSELMWPMPGAASHVVIEVDRARVLRGRIRSSGGDPVAGAQIVVTPAIPDRDPDRRFFNHRARMLAVSDRHGRFVIRGLGPQVRGGKITHPDFADHAEYDRVMDTTKRMAVTLEPGSWIQGRLVDETGASPPPGVGRLVTTRTTLVELDADGGFRSGALPGSVTRGTLHVDGFPPVALAWEPGAGPHALGDVALPRGAPVRLSIRDAEGAAVAGATIEVAVVAELDGRPVRVDRLRTDVDGGAETRAVEGDRFTLTVDAVGFQRTSGPFDRPTDPPDLEILLQRDAVLSGRIVDEDGRPIPGARIGVRTGSAPWVHADATTTLEDGRFGAHGVPPGRPLQVSVDADGYRRALRDVASLDPAARQDLGEVTLVRGATIRGTVVDATGRPLADLPLSAEQAQRVLRTGVSMDPWTETDAEGRFELAGLQSTVYVVRARRGGQAAAPTRVDLTEQASAHVVIQIAGGGEDELRRRGRPDHPTADGRPVPGPTNASTSRHQGQHRMGPGRPGTPRRSRCPASPPRSRPVASASVRRWPPTCPDPRS